MSTKESEIVLDTSEYAASIQTVTGWVSRDGRFFGDQERIARWDGCTHRACEGCGNPTSKHYIRCDACRAKKELEAFSAMEARPWDGKQMIFCEAREKYFSDPCEASEDWGDEERDGEPMLVLCEPVFARALSTEYWDGELPGEEPEVPDALQALVDEFNEKLAKLPELSWTPGKYRLA